MKQEYIRLFDQRIIGILETDTNGDQIARDYPSRQILGFYRKKYDHTTNFIGTIVSKGNTVVSFIYNKDK